MKNLSWKAYFETQCDKRISFSIKIKYKKTVCKVVLPDIDWFGSENTLEKNIYEISKTVFGKKKGKKIADQVFNELSEL